MDENQNLAPQNSAPAPGANDASRENQERVYEFTSDLNIAPIKNPDQEDRLPPTDRPLEKVPTALQDAVSRLNIEKDLQGKASGAPSPKNTATQAPANAPQSRYQEKISVPQYGNSIDERKGGPGENSTGSREPDKEKALRTYESDIAEYMARKNISSATMAIAEQEKKAFMEPKVKTIEKIETFVAPEIIEPETSKKEDLPAKEPAYNFAFGTTIDRINKNTASDMTKNAFSEEEGSRIIVTDNKAKTMSSGKKLFYLLLSMIFILGGIIVVYYVYNESQLAKKNAAPNIAMVHKSVVSADSQTTIAIDGLTPGQIRDKIVGEMQTAQPTNTVKEIIINKTTNSIATNVTGPQMLDIMGITPPDILKRSLTDDWMLGIYEAPDGSKDIFVIATQDFFQNTFAGLLSWEGTMMSDLSPFTASGTIVQGQFIDGITSNKDVREFKSSDGSVILLYSMIDNQHIVFASKEATIKEIIYRLENQVYSG